MHKELEQGRVVLAKMSKRMGCLEHVWHFNTWNWL